MNISKNSDMCQNDQDYTNLTSVNDIDPKNLIIIYDINSNKAYCFSVDDLQVINSPISFYEGISKTVRLIRHPYIGVLLDETIIEPIEKKWNTILITHPRQIWSGSAEYGRNISVMSGKPIHRKTFLTGTVDDMKREIVTVQYPEDISNFGDVQDDVIEITAEEQKKIDEIMLTARNANEARINTLRNEARVMAERNAEENNNRESIVNNSEPEPEPEPLFSIVDYLDQLPDNTTEIDVSNKAIGGLPSLIRFVHLETLKCSNNIIESLPELPESLLRLFCGDNPINHLRQLPSNLQILSCVQTHITELPPLPETLTHLYCSNCMLSGEFPRLHEGLKVLNFSMNRITSITNLPSTLEELFCSQNRLTALPVPLPPQLTLLYCHRNRLVEIPPLPNSITNLSCYENNLRNIPERTEHMEEYDCGEQRV